MRRVVLPNEEWRELGGRRRREVARLARHGRPHPDAYVAAVARAWASQMARPEREPRIRDVRSAVRGPGGAGLTGLAAAFVGAAASLLLPGGSAWRERRLARQILSATAT